MQFSFPNVNYASAWDIPGSKVEREAGGGGSWEGSYREMGGGGEGGGGNVPSNVAIVSMSLGLSFVFKDGSGEAWSPS